MVRALQAFQTQDSRLRTTDLYAWSCVLGLVSCTALISAGVVFVLCAGQWLQGASASEQIERNLGPGVVERFRQVSPAKGGNGQQTHSALVRQAETFALYLNPPQPPKGEEAPAPKRISKQTIPAAIAAKVTPKFRLVGTSYYRSRPEESMALVSEPGSGTHWVKQGARLGHFVLEKVKRGTIVYRQGDRLREMAVDTKIPVATVLAQQTKPASGRGISNILRKESLGLRRASSIKHRVSRRALFQAQDVGH